MSTVAENEWEGLLFCGKQCINNNKKVLEVAASQYKVRVPWQTDGTTPEINLMVVIIDWLNKRGELQLMAWRHKTKWHDKNGHCK